MQEFEKQLSSLQSSINDAVETLKIGELEAQSRDLQTKAALPDFWSNPDEAQEVMKQQSRLQARVTPWRDLQKGLKELLELAQLNDASLQSDLEKQYEQLAMLFEQLKQQLKFSGPYDDYDVIMSIHAGAGGTDAQDWAAMLMRMYVRWAESETRRTAHRGVENSSAPASYHKYDSVRASSSPSAAPSDAPQKYSVKSIEESTGEEAGIKSVTLEISGPFAYGKLKGEHGVHRLVRLSPFNSDNLRQTSFAKVDVLPKIDRPDALELNEKDLKIDVYRAGGRGGQSVNTTDSAVRITHIPTGLTVSIQNERSQLQNKETAMTILRSQLVQLQMEQHKDSLQELKGPNQSAEWGNQIRSYVLHPYKQVKDLRTRHETSSAEAVLDGDLDEFIDAYLEHTLGD